MGDGIATSISALLGGPANTTYGENTGVIGMTKVSSVYVTVGAACIAIVLSCVPIVSAFISTIPNAVLGGMSIILYGVIASNGRGFWIDNQVDFGQQRNLIIASAMLVIGLGRRGSAVRQTGHPVGHRVVGDCGHCAEPDPAAGETNCRKNQNKSQISLRKQHAAAFFLTAKRDQFQVSDWFTRAGSFRCFFSPERLS